MKVKCLCVQALQPKHRTTWARSAPSSACPRSFGASWCTWTRTRLDISLHFLVRLLFNMCTRARPKTDNAARAILHGVIYYQFAIVDYAHAAALSSVIVHIRTRANCCAARLTCVGISGFLVHPNAWSQRGAHDHSAVSVMHAYIMHTAPAKHTLTRTHTYAHAHLNGRIATQRIYRVRNSHINSF